MKEEIRSYILKLLYQLAALDQELVILAVLIFCAIIVLDAVTMRARKQRQATGVETELAAISIDGSKSLPVRHYLSEIQGLAGRPDGVIIENSFFIPVERKPLATKIRDRYVAQLLVYMRLIEEFEGKKPPHGYLILGPKCRKIKIENTLERQAWLQSQIDQMQEILQGKPAIASPLRKKCSRCDVREACMFRGDLS